MVGMVVMVGMVDENRAPSPPGPLSQYPLRGGEGELLMGKISGYLLPLSLPATAGFWERGLGGVREHRFQ